MKKSKVLLVSVITIIMCAILCISMSALAVAPSEDDTQIQPRTASEGENEIQPRSTPAEGDENEPMPVSENGEEGTPYETGSTGTSYDIYEEDLYVTSNDASYVMDKLVDGNVFIMGNNVKITGTISGSLFVMANSLEIAQDALISSHVFALAADMKVDGAAYDIYACAENFTLGEEATVGRDAKVVASTASLAGQIGRDILLTASTVSVPSEAGKLTIYGDLEYSATSEIENKDMININGEIKYNQVSEDEEDTENTVLDYVYSAINTVVFDVVLYIGFLFLAPKFVGKAKEYVSAKAGLSLVFGLAFLVLVPILAILLLAIEVGVGLAGILTIVYLSLLMLSAFVVAVVINEFLATKVSKIGDDKFKKGLLLIPVSLVLWGIRKIPFVGGIIGAAVLLCGIGIIVMYQFDKMKKEKETEKVSE